VEGGSKVDLFEGRSSIIALSSCENRDLGKCRRSVPNARKLSIRPKNSNALIR